MPETEAQRKARQKYQANNKDKRKNITLTLPADEEAHHRLIMQEHGVTPIQVGVLE